jgi:hypothetical protein
MGLEFEEGGNTIWVHGSCGTLLRIKCSGQIKVKRCSAPGAHADVLVGGDIEFCVPAGDDVSDLDAESSRTVGRGVGAVLDAAEAVG